MKPELFKLDEGEKSSALWLRLSAHFEKRLSNLRKENDSLESSELDTAARRGRIKELTSILELGTTRPFQEPPQANVI